MADTSHVVAHDGNHGVPFGFECLHCHAKLGFTLPVSVDEFSAAGKAFVDRHRDSNPQEASHG